MMYIYWALVAVLIVLNVIGTTAISWWVIGAMVAGPAVIVILLFLIAGGLAAGMSR